MHESNDNGNPNALLYRRTHVPIHVERISALREIFIIFLLNEVIIAHNNVNIFKLVIQFFQDTFLYTLIRLLLQIVWVDLFVGIASGL